MNRREIMIGAAAAVAVSAVPVMAKSHKRKIGDIFTVTVPRDETYNGITSEMISDAKWIVDDECDAEGVDMNLVRMYGDERTHTFVYEISGYRSAA